ncbi:MAG: hypothetical protein H6Q53_1133 [Deltaproteobacteria bacterium]|nr:hypothetical protein [Deltaproteobacteria bacterium]
MGRTDVLATPLWWDGSDRLSDIWKNRGDNSKPQKFVNCRIFKVEYLHEQGSYN